MIRFSGSSEEEKVKNIPKAKLKKLRNDELSDDDEEEDYDEDDDK